MRLEDHFQFPVRKKPAERFERFGQFSRMMRIIFIQQKILTGTMRFHPAGDAGEGSGGFQRSLPVQQTEHRHGLDGDLEVDLRIMRPSAEPGIVFQFIRSVVDNPVRMILKNRQRRREQFFPLPGELLKIPDQTFRRVEIPGVIVFDVGDYRQRGMDCGMGAIAFIGFADEDPAASGRTGDPVSLKFSADQEPRREACLTQNMDDHGSHAGLAVRAGNRYDARKKRSGQAQRFPAQDARRAAPPGFLQFRIVRCHCGTVNHQQALRIRRIREICRGMSVECQIGSAGPESELLEDPPQRFGAGAFAADEMNPGCGIFPEGIQIDHFGILTDTDSHRGP